MEPSLLVCRELADGFERISDPRSPVGLSAGDPEDSPASNSGGGGWKERGRR
jgi:hypothetical protein